MNYELRKQLKDAGFPKSSDVCTHCEYPLYDDIPTLSELIEACGDGFKGLLPPHFPLMQRCQEWGAILEIGWIKPLEKESTPDFKSEYSNWNICSGSTPEEAVANLWLKLNKNK